MPAPRINILIFLFIKVSHILPSVWLSLSEGRVPVGIFFLKKGIFIIFPTTSPYGYSSFPKEEKLCRKLTKLQFIT